jgi:hypothetical protein
MFFADMLDSGEVAFCTWIPTGDTVDTALPALYKLVAGKPDWRAIVVQTEADRQLAPASKDDNPFDFLQNAGRDTCSVTESQVPLIRLTHMLGGIPEPEVRFEAEEILDEETNKISRVVYKPIRDPDAAEEHKRLTEKYRMTENQPTEVLLVSTRQMVDHTAEEIHSAWNMRLETQSSEFCYRNQYPNVCRFIVFEVLNDRHSLYSGCIFKLWTLVLLLAQNRIAPSALQAYRLYHANITLNEENLTALFDKYLNRLAAMTVQLDEEEANKESLRTAAAKAAPNIDQSVEVTFAMKEQGSLYIGTKEIGYTKDRPRDEKKFWHEAYLRATAALRDVCRSPRRVLDVAADDCRTRSIYPAERVELLNDFQRTDLEENMEQLYMDALEARSHLGMDVKKRERERRIINRQVEKRIDQRVTHRGVSAGLAIGAAVCLACMVPCLVYAAMNFGVSTFLWTLLIAAAAAFVPVVFGLAEVWIQRKETMDAMEDYNRSTTRTMMEIERSAQHYSTYLTALCSYLRGKSYLDTERYLRSGKANVSNIRRMHRAMIEKCSAVIRAWGSALGLSLEPVPQAERAYSFEAEIAPGENPAYHMEPKGVYNTVRMKGMGAKLEFPFDFLDEMSLEREELYDNADSSKPD